MNESAHPSCPHCGLPMARWAQPAESGWTGGFQYVCFNDECPYFVRGWEWMQKQYNVRASYRHRIDAETGGASPLPVLSARDCRAGIIAGEETSHAE